MTPEAESQIRIGSYCAYVTDYMHKIESIVEGLPEIRADAKLGGKIAIFMLMKHLKDIQANRQNITLNRRRTRSLTGAYFDVYTNPQRNEALRLAWPMIKFFDSIGIDGALGRISRVSELFTVLKADKLPGDTPIYGICVGGWTNNLTRSISAHGAHRVVITDVMEPTYNFITGRKHGAFRSFTPTENREKLNMLSEKYGLYLSIGVSSSKVLSDL